MLIISTRIVIVEKLGVSQYIAVIRLCKQLMVQRNIIKLIKILQPLYVYISHMSRYNINYTVTSANLSNMRQTFLFLLDFLLRQPNLNNL